MVRARVKTVASVETGSPSQSGGDVSPPGAGAIPGAEVLTDRAWGEVGRSLRLSGRELEIARCVFDDCKELMIAGRLGISPHTVRTHLERVYRKLGVNSRVELVVKVVDEFLRLTRTEGADLPPICWNRAAGRCPLCD
ncbi:MAG: helix-turn-helix transcriptional regulator [Phycisphaeraceae bacterium]